MIQIYVYYKKNTFEKESTIIILLYSFVVKQMACVLSFNRLCHEPCVPHNFQKTSWIIHCTLLNNTDRGRKGIKR